MDQPPPYYDHLDPATLYELLRVHRQNLAILEVRAAKFGSLEQPLSQFHHLHETRIALEGLIAEFKHRGLNPEVPPAGMKIFRRTAIMAPRLPESFVDRPTELEHLLATILDPTRTQPVAITTALQGAGGFGKTTLAAALCHTPAVINAFPDGILWITLGETPRLMDALTKLCDALNTNRPSFVDEEQGAITLTTLLQDRRCLIVLDDVWKPEHLRPFLRGTTTSTWLITTRSSSVAAPARLILVDTMTVDEAVQLLTNRLSAPPSDLTPFRTLAHRLGEWPLLLELAGAALRARVERGEPLTSALQSIHKLLDKRGVVAFDQRDAQERHQAVATTLAVSLDLLSPEERTAYQDLAVFPEDIDVLLVTLGRLWDMDDLDTEHLALTLDSLSLLKLNLQTRTIRLHDVLRAFLIHQAGPALPALHQRLLDHYAETTWARLPHDELYLWRHLIYHLIGAKRSSDVLQTVTDLHYVATKAFLFGTTAVEQDFRTAASIHAEDLILLPLMHTFIRISHLLHSCTTMRDLEATLYSRIQHLDVLQGLLTPFRACMQVPYIIPWYPLPDTLHPTLIRTLTYHTKAVNGCSMSADGRVIASASRDRTLKVFDISRGTEQITITSHKRAQNSCSLTGNGRMLVSIEGESLKVWDAHTGAEQHTLTGHTQAVMDCAISAHGDVIASVSSDGMVKLWDARTGSERLSISSYLPWKHCAISADGTVVVSISHHNHVKVWNTQTGGAQATIVGHSDRINSCAISADGRILVTASDDWMLKVWNAFTGTLLVTLKGHKGRVSGCDITADGTFVVSASNDRTVKLWDVRTGGERATLIGHTGSVRDCAISDNGSVVVSASADSTLKVWHIATTIPFTSTPEYHERVNKCAISEQGDFIVSALWNKTVKLWDTETHITKASFKGHRNRVSSCAMSADGSVIVSASWDKTLKVWNTRTATEQVTLIGHKEKLTDCAISTDGTLVVSASEDRTIKVWNANTGVEHGTLTGHSDVVSCCILSQDSKLIVSASHDHTLKIWDAHNGKEQMSLLGHSKEVNGCDMSTDGRFIVSASNDRTLKVWDAGTGTEQTTLQGHTRGVNSCGISPNGKLIASVSWDNTLKIWALDEAECLATFYAEGALYTCIWHPDNRHVIAAGERGLYLLTFVQ
jgi:WD40 repeat protein